MAWHEAVFLDEVKECPQCDYSVTHGATFVFFENLEHPGHMRSIARDLYYNVFAGGTYYSDSIRRRSLWALSCGAWSLLSLQELPALPQSLQEYVEARAQEVLQPLAGYSSKPHHKRVMMPFGPLSFEAKLLEYSGDKKLERKVPVTFWSVRVALT